MRRRLLNDICQIEFVNKIDTIAGDVCVVDNNTLDKYFITSDSIDCLNYDLYTMYIFFTDEGNFGAYHSRTFYSYNAWLYHAISFCSI